MNLENESRNREHKKTRCLAVEGSGDPNEEGGVLVSAASPADDAPGTFEVVRLFGQNNPAQLAEIVRLIDAGELVVPIAQRLTLDDVPAVHANPPHSGKAIFRA